MLTHNTSTVFEQAIALTDFADTCGGTSAQANFTDLLIGVFDTSPLIASTYAVDPSPGPRGAVAVFGKANSCKSVLDGGEALATGGTVTFSSLTTSHAQGTFSLFFGQDTLTGSFDVDDCGSLSTDAGTAACN